MPTNINTKDNLVYGPASNTTGGLGTLRGPIADFMHPTRNGRKYPKSLWNKVFNGDIVKEMLANGGIPGELDHPADREEICSEKIAILMTEAPKEDKNGLLTGVFKILDTPCGKIVNALARAGFKLGISSRGSGDTYVNENGEEVVDESSYEFQCFDIVLLPAVKAARLNLVTESIDSQKIILKKALTEALDSSNDAEKQIMINTLSDLNLGYSLETGININADSNTLEAVDNGSSVVKDLQETLKRNNELEKKIKGLQEQLSVCYTKENERMEKFNAYQETLKQAKQKINGLTESLAQEKEVNSNLLKQIKEINSSVNGQKSLTEAVNQKIKVIGDKNSRLMEALKDSEEKLINQKEQFEKLSQSHEKQTQQLTEKYENEKADLSIKNSELSAKYQKQNALIEKYRAIARTAVDKYIKVQASKLGISSDSIKSKLSENYSFNDIDRVCEGFKSYNLNISKLPFALTEGKSVQINMKASKDNIVPQPRTDDDVDDQLLAIANIKP